MKICSHEASCIIGRLRASSYAGSYTKRRWATAFPKRGPARTHTFCYCFSRQGVHGRGLGKSLHTWNLSPWTRGWLWGSLLSGHCGREQSQRPGPAAGTQGKVLGCYQSDRNKTWRLLATLSDTCSWGRALMESIKRWNLWPGLSHGKHWPRHVKGIWKNISQATEEKGPGAGWDREKKLL